MARMLPGIETLEQHGVGVQSVPKVPVSWANQINKLSSLLPCFVNVIRCVLTIYPSHVKNAL